MNRSFRQNNKETSALKDMLYQMNLTDFYKTFHPKAIECTLRMYFQFIPRENHFVSFLCILPEFLYVYPRKRELYKYLYPTSLYNNIVLYTLSLYFSFNNLP